MKKNTPNLPGSSRMQMPSTGDKLGSKISEYGGMKNGKAAAAIKSGSIAMKTKGKTGMKGANPYGNIC